MGIRKTKIFVILIICILLISIQCNVHASMLENMWKDASDFVKLGKDSDINTFNGEQMQKSTDSLYIMFWWAGVGIAAIVGAYLGIKFMTEGIEGKAKIKEALVPYCIGCVIIFGAFGVWRIAMQLFGELEEAEANSVRDTHFHQEKCAEGNHSYSTFKDTVCTYCGYKCEHQMNGPYSDGSMICNKAGCKFKITNCESTYNGRTKQAHTWSNGICQTCGAKCRHSSWEELNKANHKCKDCGTTENHMWNKSTKCTKCNKTCNHQFYESNGEVKCRDCNIKLDSCNKRRMQHTYVRYNLYGGEICVNCYAPNPANPPSYLQNNP